MRPYVGSSQYQCFDKISLVEEPLTARRQLPSVHLAVALSKSFTSGAARTGRAKVKATMEDKTFFMFDDTAKDLA